MTELADGFLAHRRAGEGGRFRINGAIRFDDDTDAPWPRGSILPFMWGAYRVTGDAKYLQPFKDEGARSLSAVTTTGLELPGAPAEWKDEVIASARPGAAEPSATPAPAGANSGRLPPRPPPNYTAAHLAWQATGDKSYLESLYAAQIESSALREFMNTEGSLWIDRVEVPNGELQRARLGGVALTRNAIYPGHAVSWTFRAPGDEERVAIIIPESKPDYLKIVAYNMTGDSFLADMTAWDLEPGRWEVSTAVSADGGATTGGESLSFTTELERGGSVGLVFSPNVTTVFTLKLVEKGVPYWWRPDLGIGRDDVSVRGRRVTVTVHSLGAQDTRPATLKLLDGAGKTLATAPVPALKAPNDLLPKRVRVTLDAPAGARLAGGSVVVEPDTPTKEITIVNNRVRL